LPGPSICFSASLAFPFLAVLKDPFNEGKGAQRISAPDRNLLCGDFVSGAVDAAARGWEKKQRYPGTEGSYEGGNVLFGDEKRRAPRGRASLWLKKRELL